MHLRLSSPAALARAAVVLLVLLAVAARPALAQDEIDRKAVQRAHDFLKGTKIGKDICGVVHFGATYQGHAHKETRRVKGPDGKLMPGYFALAYDYDWNKDGSSEVVFICDRRGNLVEVQAPAEKSNGILNQPFLLANASIQLVGNLMIGALGNNLTEQDKKDLQKAVDNADAKELLEKTLKLRQLFSP